MWAGGVKALSIPRLVTSELLGRLSARLTAELVVLGHGIGIDRRLRPAPVRVPIVFPRFGALSQLTFEHMATFDEDQAIRFAAFAHVQRLCEVRGDLSASDLRAGFQFQGERLLLINPQRGIFKPQRMRYLLSSFSWLIRSHL